MLLIGYGNPGRGDDGLGPALVERLKAMDLPGLSLDADYQLTPEMAADLAAHAQVVFADASREPLPRPKLSPLQPRPPASFSSHGLQPAEVLYLAQRLFGASTQAFVLAIPGREFDVFREGLSAPARHQLQLAVERVLRMLSEPEPDKGRAD
ncbi:MAG: hydrogenase maturation protease [Gammaproteobacteria bacterium SHHR-1]|uniref:hydrogenase maturation protease n=1 Tax=Magnetovirga frankeli TaxID=947516 RepID=UPI001292EACE|nr:hydrogenase maturation protease [gamma proteobacterium SS-5]